MLKPHHAVWVSFWAPAPAHQEIAPRLGESDLFDYTTAHRRLGSGPLEAAVTLEVNWQPQRFRLAAPLSSLIGVQSDTRARVLQVRTKMNPVPNQTWARSTWHLRDTRMHICTVVVPLRSASTPLPAASKVKAHIAELDLPTPMCAGGVCVHTEAQAAGRGAAGAGALRCAAAGGARRGGAAHVLRRGAPRAPPVARAAHRAVLHHQVRVGRKGDLFDYKEAWWRCRGAVVLCWRKTVHQST